MALFARVCSAEKLITDVAGGVERSPENAFTNPLAAVATTVRLSETASADPGTEHPLATIGKARAPLAGIGGPPNVPSDPLVSSTLHGAIGKNPGDVLVNERPPCRGPRRRRKPCKAHREWHWP